MNDSGRLHNRNVGTLLRHWRTTRGISQLTLSLDAEISMRHLSYVETGRAEPSREMVLRLAEALGVPLRERNTLLLAAGYAPLYRETGLDAPELGEAKQAVELILAHHEPYPAVVMDRHWNLLMANPATTRFLSLFPAFDVPGAPNGLRLVFHPNGIRSFIDNWDELAGAMINEMHRELAADPSDAVGRELLAELVAYPGVPSRWSAADLDRSPTPLLVANYSYAGGLLRFFTTMTTFGTPQHVTMQELRIECFFPADERTRSMMAL
ncbi:MAG: helix-turn-helix transcriptional regulator [bacterium]